MSRKRQGIDRWRKRVDAEKINKKGRLAKRGGEERGIILAGVDWREARRWVPAVPVVTARTEVWSLSQHRPLEVWGDYGEKGEGRPRHLDGETLRGKKDRDRQSECVNKAGFWNNGRVGKNNRLRWKMWECAWQEPASRAVVWCVSRFNFYMTATQTIVSH